MHSLILAPAAILLFWSMIMLVCVTVTRLAAISRLPKDQRRALSRARTGGPDPENVLFESASWTSHNCAHLLEQPTVFILALAGAGAGINTTLAWRYAGLSGLHSIWQATVNKLPVRMFLFRS